MPTSLILLIIWSVGLLPALLIWLWNDSNGSKDSSPIDMFIWPIFAAKYFVMFLALIWMGIILVFFRIIDVLKKW